MHAFSYFCPAKPSKEPTEDKIWLRHTKLPKGIKNIISTGHQMTTRKLVSVILIFYGEANFVSEAHFLFLISSADGSSPFI